LTVEIFIDFLYNRAIEKNDEWFGVFMSDENENSHKVTLCLRVLVAKKKEV